LNPCYRL